MTAHEVGRAGEKAACRYLKEHGYDILACNYQRAGEKLSVKLILWHNWAKQWLLLRLKHEKAKCTAYLVSLSPKVNSKKSLKRHIHILQRMGWMPITALM